MVSTASSSPHDPNINRGRRRFLVSATSVVGGIATAAAIYPFVDSLLPSDRARAAGAPVDVDISKLKKGQLLTVAWRSKPVWILNRTESQLEELPKLVGRLKDPKSQEPQQPKDLPNFDPATRSIKPNIAVLVGICTHLGCVPLYKPRPGSISSNWPGGFFCPCHGSHYDLAGRVMDGSPAPLNLPVPAYFYKSDTLIRVGSLADGSEQNWQPQVW